MAAGVSAASIRNWENGRFEPFATPIARIAEYLDLPLRSFFESTEAA